MTTGNFATRCAMFASVVGLIASSPMFANTVNADTTSVHQVTAVKNVYLRSTPGIARNAIVQESTGSTFTVVSGSTAGWWHVSDANGRMGYVINNATWVHAVPVVQAPPGATLGPTISQPPGATLDPTISQPPGATLDPTKSLPPGVTLDPNLSPLAATDASTQDKFNAILSVAQSKLGTPYVWGHNEDRGQFGFDCSNFTAYVYHHALGYKMSGASQTQFHSVGWDVSSSDMQPGDLLIFNNGGHVGIYIGNNRMIEEGGGLGKVGYLSVGPGSYWDNHLTAVRRMF